MSVSDQVVVITEFISRVKVVPTISRRIISPSDNVLDVQGLPMSLKAPLTNLDK